MSADALFMRLSGLIMALIAMGRALEGDWDASGAFFTASGVFWLGAVKS